MSSTLKKKCKNYVMQDIFANVKDQLLSFSFGKHFVTWVCMPFYITDYSGSTLPHSVIAEAERSKIIKSISLIFN